MPFWGLPRVTPLDGESFLNGNLITESTSVNGGARLIFGQFHVFRFVNPQEALKAREASKVRLFTIASG